MLDIAAWLLVALVAYVFAPYAATVDGAAGLTMALVLATGVPALALALAGSVPRTALMLALAFPLMGGLAFARTLGAFA